MAPNTNQRARAADAAGPSRFPNRPAATHPLPVAGLTGVSSSTATASAATPPAASVVGAF